MQVLQQCSSTFHSAVKDLTRLQSPHCGGLHVHKCADLLNSNINLFYQVILSKVLSFSCSIQVRNLSCFSDTPAKPHPHTAGDMQLKTVSLSPQLDCPSTHDLLNSLRQVEKMLVVHETSYRHGLRALRKKISALHNSTMAIFNSGRNGETSPLTKNKYLSILY